jgi:SAM-dependent methyltransferase
MESARVNEVMREYYEGVLAERGAVPEGVDWKSREAQEQAFAVFAHDVIEPGSSVLDVGCGLAHLADWLEAHGFAGSYTGVDIAPRMIEAARERRPDLDLRAVDVLEDDLGRRFDNVVACGVFTEHFDVPYDEFDLFVERLVARMWELADVSVSFNMLTDAVDFRVDRLHYASPSRWLDFGRTLTRNVVVRHDYPAYFFTVQLFREPRTYPQ